MKNTDKVIEILKEDLKIYFESTNLSNSFYDEIAERIATRIDAEYSGGDVYEEWKHHSHTATDINEDEIDKLAREFMESDEFILSFPYTFKRGFKACLSKGAKPISDERIDELFDNHKGKFVAIFNREDFGKFIKEFNK